MGRRALPHVIEGRHHPLLKKVRQRVRSGELLAEGEVLLETPTLVEEALASGAPISCVLVSKPAAQHVEKLLRHLSPETKLYEVPAKLFTGLVSLESHQGILALAPAPQWRMQDLLRKTPALVVVLAGVQDPGNLGTIVRTAEAFGATGLLLLRGTVSPYNAKAIRATAGALFRLPVLSGLTAGAVVQWLRQNRVSLLACVSRGGQRLAGTKFSAPVALAFGSEGAGLPPELLAAGQPLSIPMTPKAESLNVAVAAAVVLYEVARQRNFPARAASLRTKEGKALDTA
ncbi:MAG: RNA methyltransferase [Acidobacteria bacterium]|nr:RNA methyltransferase [Acidobacteriota bacterium]